MSETDTMQDVYESHRYEPEQLTHPRNVTPSDISDTTVVVAYTVVRNPDPNGPATTWDVREYEIEGVVPVENVEEYSDSAVYFTDDTPATHAVHWANDSRGPKMEAINYGNEMYGSDSDFDDPYRWDRPESHVLGLSDDFIQFDL